MAKSVNISSQQKLGFLSDSASSREIVKNFGRPEDYIELHILNSNNKLLFSESNFTEYTSPTLESGPSQNSGDKTSELFSQLELDPTEILNNRGYISGRYKLKLNVLRKKIFNIDEGFTIKEISPSRKELRLISPNVDNELFNTAVRSFQSEIESAAYFKEFYLNFKKDVHILGVNMVLNHITNKSELLVKTLDPVPPSIKPQAPLSICEYIVDPQIIDIDLGQPIILDDTIDLRGPNWKIDTRTHSSIPSEYKNYNQILNYSLTSSYQRLLNQLENKEVPNIQYDYIRPVSESFEGESDEEVYHFENFVL